MNVPEPDVAPVATLAELPFYLAERFDRPVLLRRCVAEGFEEFSTREFVDQIRALSLGLRQVRHRAAAIVSAWSAKAARVVDCRPRDPDGRGRQRSGLPDAVGRADRSSSSTTPGSRWSSSRTRRSSRSSWGWRPDCPP